MKFRPVALAVAASLAAGAVSVPTFASAQTYGGAAAYDPCTREARQRQTTGAVLGAILGAAAGSGVAAKGAKTEGGVLGAAVGAAVGAKAGQRSAACGTAGQGYGSNGYGYGDGYYGARDYGYREPAYDPYARPDHDHDHDYEGYRRPVSDGPAVDGCRLAESPIYLPDGRTEKRYVRVCPDENGRYRVVD